MGNYSLTGRRKLTYGQSLVRVITHLAGTAVMFSALLVLSWAISYLAAGLHSIHPFPPEIYTFLTKVELWLLYVDVVISGLVFFFGAARFVQEAWEGT